MRLLHSLRTRVRLLFARRAAESRMNQELGFHIEMETERLVREAGLDPGEARRQALIAFGGMEQYKEELRDNRGLAWLSGLTLDLKLAGRMLVKYPGLTVVSIAGMAVAVAIGAVSFALIYSLLDPPPLPLDQGHRVVAVHNFDTRHSVTARDTHLHDLADWREAVPAVAEWGAYRLIDRNLITGEGRPEPVRIAEMTASGFRIARVAPFLGRYFSDGEERPGAPPVVVLGYGMWQRRFAGDSGIVGRTIQLGMARLTVIGIMPPGFAFPVNNRVWTPFRLEPLAFDRGEAPAVEVFGRLAPDASLAEAEAQLSTVGARLAGAFPRTHEHVKPRVMPYTHAFVESPELTWLSHLIQLLISMLLVVIGANVGILVYARTATRIGELAVRTALGASRGRIVGQLGAEAFLLSLGAAGAGLLAAGFAFEQLNAFLDRAGGDGLPFWLELAISPGMVVYVLALAVLGAIIVGVLPALKATRRQVQPTMQLSAGGIALRLGRAWTGMIVAQVALAVSVLPLAMAGGAVVYRQTTAPPAVAPGEWTTARVYLDREDSAEGSPDGDVRTANLQSELLRQVRNEVGVVSAVWSSSVPGEEGDARVEVEGSGSQHLVQAGRVSTELFAAYNVPLMTGRGFELGDVHSTGERVRDGQSIVVNRAFVRAVLGDAEPLGRRVRQVIRRSGVESDTARAEPWLEIVGVVADFPNPVNPRFPEPRMYRPLAPGAVNPVTIAVRMRNGSNAFGGRLREIALGVDPMLRVEHIAPLDDSLRARQLELRVLVGVVAVVTLSVLLLSAAGIYALISFSVTRHRREIGLRAALGAGPRGIIRVVLGRAVRPIVLGIGIGVVVAGLVDSRLDGGFTGGRGIYLLAMVAAFMTTVGLIAAIGPTRRALRIQPTEALKSE